MQAKRFASLFSVFFLAVALLLAGCSSQGAQTEAGSETKTSANNGKAEENQEMPDFAKIAGATSGGTYFLLANAMAQLFGQEIEGTNFTAQSTPGSPKILELLNEGGAELGIAQSGVAAAAFNGKAKFEGRAFKNIRQVSFFYPNVMQFVVHKDSGIESVSELKGKSVSVGAVGSATELNSRDLFIAHDIDYPDGITPQYKSETQAANLLKNKKAAGANMIAALGSAAMLDLMSTGDYKILPISKDVIKNLHDEVNPAYYEITIPANTYPNQKEPIQTYAVANWLHARADVSEDFVYQTLKILYNNLDYMVDTHKVTENIKLENALNGQTIPLHPGAVKFYKEQGIDVEQ